MGMKDWLLQAVGADNTIVIYADKPANKYSFDNVKYFRVCVCAKTLGRFLYNVLRETSALTAANRVLVFDTLQELSQVVVWGDRQDNTEIVDFYMEHDLLGYCMQLVRTFSQQRDAKSCARVIQSVTLVYDNVRRDTTIY